MFDDTQRERMRGQKNMAPDLLYLGIEMKAITGVRFKNCQKGSPTWETKTNFKIDVPYRYIYT